MSIVMYGASPDGPWEPLDPAVPRSAPIPLPMQPVQGREALVGPSAPESAADILRRIDERIVWLRNELKMHHAWKAELALLEKMSADLRGASVPNESDPEVKR